MTGAGKHNFKSANQSETSDMQVLSSKIFGGPSASEYVNRIL